nr:hypothetical protein [Tanacetum cinerariifolium]
VIDGLLVEIVFGKDGQPPSKIFKDAISYISMGNLSGVEDYYWSATISNLKNDKHGAICKTSKGQTYHQLTTMIQIVLVEEGFGNIIAKGRTLSTWTWRQRWYAYQTSLHQDFYVLPMNRDFDDSILHRVSEDIKDIFASKHD